MPAVESPNKLRRIAVLIASVDATTARQLLLQLPTDMAKEVRGILQTIGPIDPAERQRIVAEFQSTAARHVRSAPPTQASAQRGSAAPRIDERSPMTTASGPLHLEPRLANASAPQVSSAVHAYDKTAPRGYDQGWPHQSAGPSQPTLSADDEPTDVTITWKRMDTRGLSQLLAGERPTVIAVVISQLAPEMGVSLLQQLPVALHSDVLQRMVHLQDIDTEAMQAIDEHLAERLKDYEHQVNSEAQNGRRISSLIAVAPAHLQQTWLQMLRETHNASMIPNIEAALRPSTTGTSPQSPPTHDNAASSSPPQTRMNTEPNLNSTVFGSVITTADAATANPAAPTTAAAIPASESAMEATENSHILLFPGLAAAATPHHVDRSLLQLDFERILQLSPHQLAQVLTQAESQTVLLALAGASPAFMKRFYLMLTKSDAKILASRLSEIGQLKLRDIDDAQRQIVELKVKLFSSSQNRTTTVRAA